MSGEGIERRKYNKFKTLDSAIPKSAFLYLAKETVLLGGFHGLVGWNMY